MKYRNQSWAEFSTTILYWSEAESGYNDIRGQTKQLMKLFYFFEMFYISLLWENLMIITGTSIKKSYKRWH